MAAKAAEIKELKATVQQILDKVNAIDTKFDIITKRVTEVERKCESLDTRVTDLENGAIHMEVDQQELKTITQNCVMNKSMLPLYKRLADLGNRNRRNNLVISNVPEEYEKGKENEGDMLKNLVVNIANKLSITKPIEIERAHRGAFKPSGSSDGHSGGQPRKIYVRLLKQADREEILKKTPDLKGFKVLGQQIYVGDDIEQVTVNIHKKLVVQMKKMRQDGKYAFIPNSLPRVIKYRDGPPPNNSEAAGKQKQKLKTWRLSDEEIDQIYIQTYKVATEAATGVQEG
jgi:hypothetical protein